MQTVLPREEAVEGVISKVLESQEACDRLNEVFYEHLENYQEINDDGDRHFAEVLLQAYKNGDVSALLLELCGGSMFDLLRDAYLIPKKFHGKSGENPVLLTDVEGKLLESKKREVTALEYEKFHETYRQHQCAPRSKLYLADGYDIVRSYTEGMQIQEKKENKKRGVMALYALPDTRKLGLTEAQAYAVVWDTFQKIQKQAPRVEVYYGQDTGEKRQKGFDEIGVLLPIHGFEKRMLHHLDEIDGIVLSCREKMMKKAGAESLDLE